MKDEIIFEQLSPRPVQTDLLRGPVILIVFCTVSFHGKIRQPCTGFRSLLSGLSDEMPVDMNASDTLIR